MTNQTYVDLDCWQLDDGRVFVGNRATEYVPLTEADSLRAVLKLIAESPERRATLQLWAWNAVKDDETWAPPTT